MFSQCAVTVAAFAPPPIKDGLQQQGSVVVGDLHKHHRVMQACGNSVQCFSNARFLSSKRRKITLQTPCVAGVCVGRAATGEACPASGATSSLSLNIVKNK